MKLDKNKLIELIEPIFKIYGEEIIPANEKQIENFVIDANRNNLPKTVIEEITQFYRITNGIPRGIFPIEEQVLFEWWNDDKEIWLGQVDMDTIRWKNENYHLGSASDLNYGKEYISDNIYGILKIGIRDWYNENE